MSLSHSPQSAATGLVLNLDAGNTRSLGNVNRNLLSFSENLDNAYWLKSNCSVLANSAIAPDGTLTADKIIANNVNTQHLMYTSINVVGGTTYVWSCYAKASEYNIIQFNRIDIGGVSASFNLAAGTVSGASSGTASIVLVGNGWYRCIFVYTPPTTLSMPIAFQPIDLTGAAAFVGNNTNGVLAWGLQFEGGTAASDYYSASNNARLPTWTNLATRVNSDTNIPAIANLETTPVGQTAFTTAGTFSWTAPLGVTSVSVLAIGGGAGGLTGFVSNRGAGGGGGLGWKNNITVVPGQSYTVVVGQSGITDSSFPSAGGTSYFNTTSTVFGGGGQPPSGQTGGGGGSWFGDGGGSGGKGGDSDGESANHLNGGGGGGAGGYNGNGGTGANGFTTTTTAGLAGLGGGGGGGGSGIGPGLEAAGRGGGTGVFGEGSNGSGGPAGGYYIRFVNIQVGPAAGSGENGSTSTTGYGGGGGSGGSTGNTRGNGSTGAVRIIWGPNRRYPATSTLDQPTVAATPAPIFSTSNGGFFTFNGTSNVITTSHTSPVRISLSIWWRTASTGQIQYLLDTNTNSTIHGFNLQVNSSLTTLTTTLGNVILNASSSVTFTPDFWYNIVVTYDGLSINRYVNGALSGTSSILNSPNIAYSTNSFNIGASSSNTFFTAGAISSVSVHSKALSATEITQNFNALRSRYGI